MEDYKKQQQQKSMDKVLKDHKLRVFLISSWSPSRRKEETTGKSWKRVKVLGFLLSYLFCLSVLGEEGVGIDGSDLSISANLYIIEEN